MFELRINALKQMIIIEAFRCGQNLLDEKSSFDVFNLEELNKTGKKETFNEYVENCSNYRITVFAAKENAPSGSNDGELFYPGVNRVRG